MKVFLHVDLDAFFASVEQLDFPEYRGKPVIVGGNPSVRRSVVSTCSYEARKFGVHSAMPSAQAKILCPEGIFLPGRMERYLEKSMEVMSIFQEFSPDIQQISIDEAFIDITGTERLFGPPEETAIKLKKRVYEKTGLTVSAGLATNKYVAKIASGMFKPDGFCNIKPGEEEAFILSLPIEKIWGAGEKTQQRLISAGFRTVYDIHKASESLLQSLLGESSGHFLYEAVRGQVDFLFREDPKSHSISAEHTFPCDLTETYHIETELMQLCQEVQFRMLKELWSSKTVHIKIRYGDFSTFSIQETGDSFIKTAEQLYQIARILFFKKWSSGRGIRLLGVGTKNCVHTAEKQNELFDFGEKKQEALEKTILTIHLKNPDVTIQKARLLIERIEQKQE